MENTTVITSESPTPRERALERAIRLIMELREDLQPHLIALSEEERKHMLPVPHLLPTVGPEVLQAASTKPVLTEVVVDFKPALVARHLAEGALMAQLDNQLQTLARSLGDTRNTALAEAFRSLLALYRVAKPLADNDVSFVPIARPLADMFSDRVAKKGKPFTSDT